MAYSIMLDAGHGGTKDPGAVYKGRQEKDDNLRLVLAIGEILSDRGLDVSPFQYLYSFCSKTRYTVKVQPLLSDSEFH